MTQGNTQTGSASEVVGKEPFYGWQNVWVSFISYGLAFGFVYYAYAVVFPVMIKDMGWARGDASVAQTIRGLFSVLWAPLVGYLIVKWGVRRTILSGGMVLCLALVLMATVMYNIWVWTIIWGLLAGFGFAFLGPLVYSSVATYWFNKYKGTALGIIMTGAAVGGFIGQPALTWVMKQYTSWQMGWGAAAVATFFAVIIAVLLKNKPEDHGQHKDGISPERAKQMEATATKKKVLTYRTSVNFTTKEALKTHQFWILSFNILMNYSALLMLISHGVLHFLDMGLTRMQAAYIMSFYFIGGAISRVPMGWLSDRIEGRWLLILTDALSLATMAYIWQSPNVTGLAVASFIFGFSYGANYTLVPLVLGSYYGSTNFPKIFGITLPICYTLGTLVPVIAGYTHQLLKSYDNFFIGLLILLALCTVVTFAATPAKKPASA